MAAQTPLFKELKIIYNGKGLQITCLILDNEGIIWLGGPQGVFTYDGGELTQIYNANRMSKAIISLFQDSKGTVWAGSKGGNILQFINYKDVAFVSPNNAPKSEITCIAEMDDGTICFGTKGEGFFLYNQNKLFNFKPTNNLSDNTINCLIKNSKGEMVTGCNSGIIYFAIKGNTVQILKRLDKLSGLKNNIVKALTYYGKEELVIGYYENGANLYNEKTKIFKDCNIDDVSINTIQVFENELWLGTENQGIIDCEFSSNPSVRNLQILENYGIIKVQKILNTPFYFQIILGDNKVFVTQGEWIQKITVPEEINNLQPKAISVSNGNILAVYGNGIFKKSIEYNSEWKVVNLLSKIDFKNVSSIVTDKNDNIWIGSLTEGLFCFNQNYKMIKHYDQLTGLLDDCIYRLKLVDEFLYYGCKNGLGYIDINDFELHMSQTALMSVFDICSTGDNTLWLATDGNGIIHYKETGSQYFLEKLAKDKKIIHGIASNSNGKIWYTSMYYGLYLLDNNITEPINYLKNTTYSGINTFLIDNKDNIVTFHDDFISILNPESKQQYSLIGDFGFSAINYTSNMVVNYMGAYYLMSRDGIYVYQPNRFNFMKQLPAYINNINVNLQAIESHNISKFSLKYDENHLNIKLFSPWYVDNDKIRYMYVLNGLSKDTVVTSDNNINLPNLPAGTYTLKVRPVIEGSTIDTQWTQKVFVINKPWYRSIIFIVLCIFGGFFVLYTINNNFLKNRNRSNEIERQRLRQEIKILNNQINPHFLFNSLNNLISIIDIDIVNAKIYTAHLADFYRLIVAYKDNYVITLEEDLKISRIFIALQNIRFSDAIIYKVEVATFYMKCYLPPMTLQILVENAIKHNKVSRTQPLLINISVEKDFLIIKNIISPKEHLETSTKSGIKFILDRFDFVTKAKPEIIQTSKEFIVKVPLIFQEPLPV
ncbi:MAG: histidine kinase [bacterium]|nr:histidine kinase [bacterium]